MVRATMNRAFIARVSDTYDVASWLRVESEITFGHVRIDRDDAPDELVAARRSVGGLAVRMVASEASTCEAPASISLPDVSRTRTRENAGSSSSVNHKRTACGDPCTVLPTAGIAWSTNACAAADALAMQATAAIGPIRRGRGFIALANPSLSKTDRPI